MAAALVMVWGDLLAATEGLSGASWLYTVTMLADIPKAPGPDLGVTMLRSGSAPSILLNADAMSLENGGAARFTTSFLLK